MARDVCGLLDQLEIARANVLGYSMGVQSRRSSSGNFPIGFRV